MKLIRFNSFKLAIIIQIIFAIFNVAYQKSFENILDNNNIINNALIIIMLFSIYLLFFYISSLVYSRVLFFVTQQMYSRLNNHYINKKSSDFNNENIGHITSRYLNNIGIFEGNIIKPLINTTQNIFFIIFSLIVIGITNIYLLIIVIFLVSILFIIPKLFIDKLSNRVNDNNIESNIYNNNLTNNISGLYEFSIASAMKKFSNNMISATKNYYYKIYKNQNYLNFFNVLVEISSKIIILLSLVATSYLVLIGKINIGVMLFMVSIIPKILSNLSEFINSYTTYKSGMNAYKSLFSDIEEIYEDAYTKRFFNYNTIYPYINYDKDKKNIDKIEINNLSINFDNKIVTFPNIVFEKGKKYILLGESGKGKSTLLKTIIGDINNYDGDIKINGNIKDKDETLYSSITYLEQFSYILNDTIENNISLNTDADVDNILKNLNFDKYNKNHVITELGNNLSGGEKQKIALARVLSIGTDIIFLDEFTANINREDAETIEKYVLDLNKTVVIISHTISNDIMKMADQIIYL